MLNQTGIVTSEMFESRCPNTERRKSGSYAIIECFEEIPCDPCLTSCKFDAVSMENINALPVCDFDKCNGCARCVGVCPGLACFVVDETVGEGKVKITLPHELLPLPTNNAEVEALGRDGQVCGKALVVKVSSGKALDKTNVISILVDEELLSEVRAIRVK